MGELKNLPAERMARPGGDRPLPNNPRAELACVASALQDAAACAKAVELLRREQFFDLQLGWIFFAITKLREAKTPVDRVTVEAWLHDRDVLEAAGGVERIRAMADEFPEPSHIEEHARIVVDCWERRELALLSRRTEALVCGAVEVWEDAKATIRREFGRATAPRSAVVGRPIGAAVEEVRAALSAAHLGQVSGVRYPWGRVQALVGLMVAREQTILCGPSEHGKTPFATEVAVAVGRSAVDALGFGEAVYFVTGEMPRDQLLMRMACSYAGLDVSRARLGLLEPHEQQNLMGWLDWLEALPIEVDPDPAPASVIAKRVRDARAAYEAGSMRTHVSLNPDGSRRGGVSLGRRRLRLVIGDHVQEFERFGEGRDRVARLESAAKGWRDDIAKGCGVATMLLSQVRAPNDVERKNAPGFYPWPTLDMLFGSPNALKSTADTVLAVQQPGKFPIGKARKRWHNVAMICALKRRFSGGGERVALRFERGLFHDDLHQHDVEFFEGTDG
jgi:replicative DNA helicase